MTRQHIPRATNAPKEWSITHPFVNDDVALFGKPSNREHRAIVQAMAVLAFAVRGDTHSVANSKRKRVWMVNLKSTRVFQWQRFPVSHNKPLAAFAARRGLVKLQHLARRIVKRVGALRFSQIG